MVYNLLFFFNSHKKTFVVLYIANVGQGGEKGTDFLGKR